MRSLRAGRQDVQHFLALVLALGLDVMSQNKLGAGLVHARLELETQSLVGLFDRPAREDFGDFGDVLLGVATVYAQGVQFQQLAAVIFIQPAGLLSLCVWFRLLWKAPRTAIRPVWIDAGIPSPCGEFGPTLIQLSR